MTVKKAEQTVEKPAWPKGFGGKDRVKGNRQGFLSRSIKDIFQTFKVLFDKLENNA